MYIYFQEKPKILRPMSISFFTAKASRLLLVKSMGALVTSPIISVVEVDRYSIVQIVKITGARKGEGPLTLCGYFDVVALPASVGVIDISPCLHSHIEQSVEINLIDVIALCDIT